MEITELDTKLIQCEDRLKRMKKSYYTAIDGYSMYGECINSKILKDSGVHLISLSLEMQSIETEIQMLKSLIDGKSQLNINVEKFENLKLSYRS